MNTLLYKGFTKAFMMSTHWLLNQNIHTHASKTGRHLRMRLFWFFSQQCLCFLIEVKGLKQLLNHSRVGTIAFHVWVFRTKAGKSTLPSLELK